MRLITPAELVRGVILPALTEVSPLVHRPNWASADRQRLLCAIAIQETDLRTRVQYGGGPGRSFWQIEAGLKYLFKNASFGSVAKEWCRSQGVGETYDEVHPRLGEAKYDKLAAGIASLLVAASSKKIPIDEKGGWLYYQEVWRPGKPHPDTWGRAWSEATSVIDVVHAADNEEKVHGDGSVHSPG